MKKRNIIASVAVASVATFALASCGSETTYTIELEANASGTNINLEDTYKVKSTAELLEVLSGITPTRTGYTFEGWYLEEDCNNKLGENTLITDLVDEKDGEIDNIYTLFANWTRNEYTVTFDYKGNAAVAGSGKTSDSAAFESTISSNVPTVAGKTANGAEMSFKGWKIKGTNTYWNFNDDQVTGNVELEAEWEIATISNAQEFVEYFTGSSTMNAEITADINMENILLDRTLDGLSQIDASLVSNSNYTGNLNHKIFGNGHTISNLSINTDLKGGGLYYKINDGGSISDLIFKDCSITGNNCLGFLSYQTSGSTSFTDITFDGFNGTITNGGGSAGLLAGVTSGDLTATGIVVSNTNISFGKYSGVLVGQIGSANTYEFTDCMVDATISAATASGDQGVGLFVGQLKASLAATVSFNGCVLKGNITGAKNIGGFIGDQKSSTATVSFNNCIVTDLDLTGTDTGSDKVNTFIGQDAATATYINSLYRMYGVNLISGKNGSQDPTQGVASYNIDFLNDVLSDNFTVTIDESQDAKLQITINGITLEAKYDPQEKDITDTPICKYDDGISTTRTDYNYEIGKINGNVTNGTSPSLSYVQAAVAGKAGNAVYITMRKPSSVDTLDGFSIKGGDLVGYNLNDNGFTGYLFVTQDELDAYNNENTPIEKSVTVCWFSTLDKVAKDVTYTFTIIPNMTTLPTNEYVSPELEVVAINGVTAEINSEDNTVINVTEGEIAWDTTNNANTYTVNVLKPTWASGDAIVTGAKSSVMAQDGTYVTVVLSAAKGDNKFTVSWSTVVDATTYNVNIGSNVTFGAKPTTGDGQNISITAIQISEQLGLSLTDKITDSIAAGTYGDFTFVGSTMKRGNSTTVSVELGKKGADYIEFYAEGAGTLTVEVSSTGSTNSSDCALYDNADNIISDVKSTTGTDIVTFTFDISAAGTYRFGSNLGTTSGDNTGRGIRVISIAFATTSAE